MSILNTIDEPITKRYGSVDQATINDLIEMLNNDDGIIRHRAHHALVEVGEPAVKPLINALKSQNDFLRWGVVKVLGQICSLNAIPALIAALEDEHYTIRWLAAESLVAIGPAVLVPLLGDLELRADSVRLREGAHHVLYALKIQEKMPQATQNVVLSLMEALDDDAPATTIEKDVGAVWSVLAQ